MYNFFVIVAFVCAMLPLLIWFIRNLNRVFRGKDSQIMTKIITWSFLIFWPIATVLFILLATHVISK